MTHENDSRYPYTHACDLIRSVSGYNKDGCCLSRSNASQIRGLIAKIIDMPDEELAKKLADYYLEHDKEIADRCVKEFFLTQEYYEKLQQEATHA